MKFPTETIVMKHFSLCLLALVVLVPGCIRRTKKNDTIVVQTSKQGKKERKRVYDEELGAFVLEDDAEYDIFNQEPNGKAQSKEAADELAWEQLENASEQEIVRFDYDSAMIKQEELKKIEKNAQRLKEKLVKKPQATITVVGHSCKMAKSEIYNNNIAQRRAEKVAKAYQQFGIPAKNIKAVGRGATMPLDEAAGEEHQRVNRRVETAVMA